MSSPALQNAWILTGPTGSGKSEFSLRLAEASNAEIVAMDSMTLYRGMDIGTAKPTKQDRDQIRHHLIDILHPWESANVAWWRERAIECCHDIVARGKRALFVGGTPLYLKALISGLFEGPPANAQVRHRLESVASNEGASALHRRLAEVDPIAAERLHPNDVKRIVRALEVHELTGRPISSWQREWQNPDAGRRVVAGCWWIERPREELYRRIDRRVQAMFDSGWVEESRRLRELPRPLSREAGLALGYREIFAYLDGKKGLAETIAEIQMRGRQFAKRQLTWYRNMPECQPVPVTGDRFPDPKSWPEFT